MKYDCSLNKHLCIRPFKSRAECLNYPKSNRSYGIEHWSKAPLDWQLCSSLAIIHTLLTSLAGQTFKNLSSRRAIKPEHSSNSLWKHSNSPTSQMAADFILGSMFSILVFPIQCTSQTEMSSLKYLAGVKKSFFWTSLKITSVFHHRGL